MVKSSYLKSLCAFTLFLFILGSLPSLTLAETDPEKAKEMYNDGITAVKEGNNDKAILSYKTAIQLDPEFLDAYLNLGALYFKQKKYDDAQDMFKKVAEKDPKNIDALANMGRVDYKLKRYPESIESFNAALALDTNQPGLYKELAKAYYSTTNKFSEAASTLEKGHKIGGGDDYTFYLLGKSYQKLEKYKQAITAFKKSLELNSKNANANFALGQIYLSQGKFVSAAGAFKTAHKSDPKKYLAMYNYAIAVESNDPDNIDTNIKNWQEFIRLAKKNPRAKNVLAQAEQHVKELKDRKEKLELQ